MKPSTQKEKFIAAAQKIECDENEAAFDAKLRRIATQKVADKPKAKRKKRK